MKNERLAVALLRGSPCRAQDMFIAQQFQILCRTALGLGLFISPGSPYVGEDEARLLAWLAIFQRQNPFNDNALPSELRPIIHSCAISLIASGIWLDFRAISRCRVTADGKNLKSDTQRKAGIADFSVRFADSSPARARALAYVREKGQVATGDFECLGISRQLVSMMAKRGILHRVRHGVYTVGPHGVAINSVRD